jgi:hypothetical protein
VNICGPLDARLALCRTSSNVHWFPRVAASLGYAQALDGGVEHGLPLLEQGHGGGRSDRAARLLTVAHHVAR